MCEITKACTTQPAWWVQIDKSTTDDPSAPDTANVLTCNRHLAMACRRVHKKRTHQGQRVTTKFAVLNADNKVVGYQ